MSLARVHNFSISLDGFATGEGQTRMHRSATPRTAAPMDVRHPVLARDGRQARRQRRHRRRLLAAVRPGSAPRSWVRTSSATPDGTRTPNGRARGDPTCRSTHRPSSSPTAAPVDRDGGRHDVPLHRRSPAEALETAREAGTATTYASVGGPTMIRDLPPGSSTTCIVVVPIPLGRGVRLGTVTALRRTIRSRPSPRPAESRM